MNPLLAYLLESHFPAKFTKAVYNAASIMLEATNINKDYLLRQAGDPEKLKEAKAAVAAKWSAMTMDQFIRNQNMAQKVINFLVLMEIREPGFVTDEIMNSIHDLANANSLEQRFLSQVNSDTMPHQARQFLTIAHENAANAAKVYPSLTPAEEETWNRVKVYHEFEDGFKWVYAVDANGNPIGYIPSSITYKTMHHCGNQPSNQQGDQYWELRGPDGKAYLTVILNKDDKISESKSYGNESNRYASMIKPYVKWFLRDHKVKGVGQRYDYGYATNKNFGVKDFMSDDQDFVNEVLENKPDLMGNNEKIVLLWREMIANSVVDEDQIRRWFENDSKIGVIPSNVDKVIKHNRFYPYTNNQYARILGDNSYDSLCSILGHEPYTEDELVALIRNRDLDLATFANHDIRQLTPRLQVEFVQANSYNLSTLNNIAEQVASFDVAPEVIESLPLPSREPDGSVDHNTEERWRAFIEYMATANPIEKCRPYLRLLTPEFVLAALRTSPELTADVIKLQNRYPGQLDSLYRVCANQIIRLAGDNVNERGTNLWTQSYRVSEALEAIANSSQETIDTYSNLMPDNISTKILMLSERESLLDALGTLASKNDKWKVNEDYITSTLTKLNSRAASYSRQTQSMLLKLFSYIGGLKNQERMLPFINIPSNLLYSRIFARRNDTGTTLSVYHAFLGFFESCPSLFSTQMFEYNGDDEHGVGAIATLLQTSDELSSDLISYRRITAEQLDNYIDYSIARRKYKMVVEACYFASITYNMDISSRTPTLIGILYMPNIDSESKYRLAYMISHGSLVVPVDKWNDLVSSIGFSVASARVFSNLPIVTRSENARKLMEMLLNSVDPSDVGNEWNRIFNVRTRGTAGFIVRMRDLLLDIIKTANPPISQEAIASLTTANVLRAADAKKLLNINSAIPTENSTFNAENISKIITHIAKIEKKKQGAVLAASMKLCLDKLAENDHDDSAYTLLAQAIEIAKLNICAETYDVANNFIAAHQDTLSRLGLLGADDGYRIKEYGAYASFGERYSILTNPTNLNDSKYLNLCEMIPKLYTRSDYAKYISAAYEYCRNHIRQYNSRRHGQHDPEKISWLGGRYWEGDSIVYAFSEAMNNLPKRAGRAEQLCQLCPDFAEAIRVADPWKRSRYAGRAAISLGINLD